MRAGFQIDVDGGFLEQFRLFHGAECVDFSVRFAVFPMVAFADDAVVVYNHRAHHRVGLHVAQSQSGEL